MSTESRDASTDEAAWACIRTIIVPNGIAPVQRRSPVPYRKRTPLRKHPDGEAMSRPGGREWFSDHVFVEPQQGHKRAGFGASLTVHVIVALVLMMAVLMGAEQTIIVKAGSSLVMPSMFVMPVVNLAAPASRSVERPVPKAAPEPTVEAPAPPAGESDPAPVEPPSEITPETGAELHADGVQGGVEGGVEGGVVGGTVKGALDGTPDAGSTSPVPPGPPRSVKPPRKIKDVRPVYPQGALAGQARGTVVIEATVGPDGKVQAAKVIRSIPALDQAAVDAVRQWEYAPSFLNGLPIAFILTVIVNFGIQ